MQGHLRGDKKCVIDGTSMLGGSWDLVSKVISTLSGVTSVVTVIITVVTKSHDPLSGHFTMKLPSLLYLAALHPLSNILMSNA